MRSELSHNGIRAGRLSLPQSQLKRCATEMDFCNGRVRTSVNLLSHKKQ